MFSIYLVALQLYYIMGYFRKYALQYKATFPFHNLDIEVLLIKSY